MRIYLGHDFELSGSRDVTIWLLILTLLTYSSGTNELQ